jgi:arylsulfatase A-like enzyme
VFLDAARAGHLGCYGYSRATTPEIDRIAADGVVFERAYTPAVYTLGAMTAAWTSQQPDPHPGELSFASRLPRDRLTLAELVSGQGVHSAGFVANAMAGRALGFDRGFAEFEELFGDPKLGSRAEVFRRVVPEFLARNRDRRFFAYVHYREPHFPYDPPAPFDTRFGSGGPLPEAAARDRDWYVSVNRGTTRPSPAEIDHLVRLYDGNLAYVDQEVGALRRALEEAGLWDRTTLVIASDHGEQLFEHGYISHSGQVYEESVRVPLIVRLPAGRAPRGVRIRQLASLADLAPTIADLMGMLGQGGSDRAFDGRSLLPVMLGGEGHPFVVSRTVWDRPVYALRDDRYKYIRATASGAEELYDLGSDPGERRNLADDELLRIAYYREALDLWLSRLRGRHAGAGERALLSPEQCENMRSLGYVEGCP